jgi:hypothetical protein
VNRCRASDCMDAIVELTGRAKRRIHSVPHKGAPYVERKLITVIKAIQTFFYLSIKKGANRYQLAPFLDQMINQRLRFLRNTLHSQLDTTLRINV